MKKLIFSLIALAMSVGIAYAGQDMTKTEARIYINPGHGSWTSNDRNMATINHSTGDTTGFYESNTNLWKGLKLRQTLLKWGVPEANILMSRVANGPDPNSPTASEDAEKYNRNLTEIAKEANTFGTDYFLSIHSDAGSGTLNVSLLIYNGYSTPAADPTYMYEGSNSLEYQKTSRAMAETLWPILTSNGIDVMTSKTPRIVGDLTFYYGYQSPADNVKHAAGYLGVLRANTSNGFLSEGYCHTYEPAAQRALNPDYCGQEGVRYARGIAAWFGWEGEKTGYIMGSVKDMHAHLEHQLYTYAPESIDQWKPINGAVVTLYKGGVEVAKYTCDDEWNGVFVFENLEPGDDYTIDAVAEGYKSVFELDDEYAREATKYTVTAHETTYPVVLLEASDYVANPTYNYAAPDQAGWLVLAEKYDMRQDFVNKPISVLEGKTIRRELAHGDSLYVLALDQDSTPHIYIINSKTQELYKELSTAGIGSANDANEMLKISDIAFTSDSILVACNAVNTTFDPTGVFRVYAWDKDDKTRTPTGDPKEWFTSATNYTSGNFSKAITGKTFAVTGSYEKCKVITTAETAGESGEVRFPIFTITRKGLIESIRNQDKTRFTKALLGDDYKLCISPRDDNGFVIDGSNTTPIEYAIAGDVAAPTFVAQMSAEAIPAAVNGVTFFKYAKHAMMVAPKANAEGKNIGVELWDVTDGFDKAKLVETSNTEIEAAEAAHLMVSTHVEDADITIYLNKDNTVSRFTTQDVEQTYYNNVYAYDLKVVAEDGKYKFTFKANEDCLKGGKLLFYDAASGEAVGEIVLDNVVAGENEKVVDASEIPGTENQVLNWSVEVASNTVAIIMPILEKNDYKLNRAYATVNNSTESAHFGHIYVSDFVSAKKVDNGVYAYDPEYNRINSTAFTGGLTFNTNRSIAVDNRGYVYVADGGASNSGIFVADPNYLDVVFNPFFEGTRAASGLITNGDAEVAGAVSSVALYGEGADTKLYAYVKNASGKYVINVYNIGNADGTLASTWGVAPSQTYSLPVSMTDDATIVPVEQGVWVAQTKTTVGNSELSPALLFVYNNGVITFNQGLVQNHHIINGVSGSAMAVSKDEKTLVINDEEGVLQFFNVEWDGAVPVLTPKYSYKHDIGIGAKRIQEGPYLEQMTFDHAGHLVASGYYLGVFTIPTENNVCVTPARSWMTVTSKVAASGVTEIVNDENAPVEYYNLQGVKVSGDNLGSGVYIKKQGRKASKVVL